MNTILLAITFTAITNQYSLPQGLLSSLCYVESKHNVQAVNEDDGRGPSLGICQIKEATAKMIGFKGSKKELMVPDFNIKYAGLYLSKQLKRYNGDVKKAVAAYNAGSYIPGKNGQPVNNIYVRKVFSQWTRN